MLCDTCENKNSCENEARQLCIANNYDKYVDDGSPYVEVEPDPLEEIPHIFATQFTISPKSNAGLISDCLSTVELLVDKTAAHMMLKDIMKAIEV